jgi:hypothetical protein
VEDYRSEKQQPPSTIKTIEIDDRAQKEASSTPETKLAPHSCEIAAPSVTDTAITSHPVKVQETKHQPNVSLRKLPIGHKAPNKQISSDNNTQQQRKHTNVSQAKSNADRKWSMQTNVKQARPSNAASFQKSPPQRPKHSNSNIVSSRTPSPKVTESKSPKQFHRSSYPPHGGQVDEDVNVKERAALWNGSKTAINNKNFNHPKERQISTAEKSTMQYTPAQRKISAPTPNTSYHQSSNDALGKGRRIKSLSMSAAPISTFKNIDNKEDNSISRHSAKTVISRNDKDNEAFRQSTNVHHPSPNKIKNMTAFFEQKS